MTEFELMRLVGKMCSWTPNMSDEVGIYARIADAVLTPTDEILILIVPVSGRGGTWVLGDEVIVDGMRLDTHPSASNAHDMADTHLGVPLRHMSSPTNGEFLTA